MTTPDGITDADWSEIEDLARFVAEATFEKGVAVHVNAVEDLLTHLRLLQSRYGPLPSILATMADYTEDHREAIRLLENAYSVAEQIDDVRNMTYIASSIAQRYVEDFSDLETGRRWAEVLRQCLARFPDATEFDVLTDLDARLRRK